MEATGNTPATLDPIQDRLRRKRRALGLTLRALARAAHIGSPAFVLSIENGTRVPSDQVARRLAQVLGEDEDLVLAWARARRRIPLRGVLEAASELLADAEVAAFARHEWFAATRAEAPPIRLRVPLLPLGADPGDDRMPDGRIGTVRIDVLPSDPPEAWLHPFAYGLARPNDAAPPRALAITRAVEHIDPRRRYVVRTAGGIVIGRAHWNGTHLVVFRDAHRDDFLVLPAATVEALRERVAGVVMREIVVPQE